MITPAALASTDASARLLAQSGGSGGSPSWELIIILVIAGTVAVALGWLLTNSGSD